MSTGQLVTIIVIGFQSCPSQELVSSIEVTHLHPVWDFYFPWHILQIEGITGFSVFSGVNEIV